MSCHGWGWRWARYFLMISIDIWSYDHKIPQLCDVFSVKQKYQFDKIFVTNDTGSRKMTATEISLNRLNYLLCCKYFGIRPVYINRTWDIGTETRWSPFLQTTLSCAFSWMKAFEFQTKFHWNVFVLCSNRQQTIIGSENVLLPKKRQSIIWTNDGIVPWCIYASLGPNELKKHYRDDGPALGFQVQSSAVIARWNISWYWMQY